MTAARAALAAAVCGLLLLGGCTRDEAGEGTPSGTPSAPVVRPASTPYPTETPTPRPEVDGVLPGLRLVEVPGVMRIDRFGVGEAVGEGTGAFFLDVATGAVERVSFDAAFLSAEETGYFQAIGSDNGLVVASLTGRVTHELGSWLLDRGTGRAFGFSQDDYWPLAISAEVVLLADFVSGELLVVRRDFSAYERIELPGALGLLDALLSADSSRAGILIIEPGTGALVAAIVDLGSGETTVLGGPQLIEARFAPPTIHLVPFGDGFALVSATAGGDGGGRSETEVRFFDFDGRDGGSLVVPARFGRVDVSPDGSRVAWMQDVRYIASPGLGGGEIWPAVAVSDSATGEILFRVRGARFDYGDGLFGTRWLADSSAIVVQGENTVGPEGGGIYSGSYYLADRDGGALTPLAGGPFAVAPLPSPDSPDLFALGQTGVLDQATGQRFAASRADREAGHGAPWGAGGSEVRFVTPHGGHDGPPLVALPFVPRLESPPWSDAIRPRVTEGSCIELRTLPDAALGGIGEPGEVTGCIEPGTLVTLLTPATIIYEVPVAVWPDDETQHYWLHVYAADGTRGWTLSERLEWGQ